MWQAYRRGIDEWFADQPSAGPEPVHQSPANLAPNPSSIFYSPSLKNRKIVGAIFDHDFAALQSDRLEGSAAIIYMIKPINEVCPGNLSEGLVRSVLQNQLGREVFGSPDEVANAGGDAAEGIDHAGPARTIDGRDGRRRRGRGPRPSRRRACR